MCGCLLHAPNWDLARNQARALTGSRSSELSVHRGAQCVEPHAPARGVVCLPLIQTSRPAVPGALLCWPVASLDGPLL